MTLLCVSSAIALASTTRTSTRVTAQRGVARAMTTARHDRLVLRFFRRHPWLLKDPRYAAEARRQIRLHRRSLASALRVIASHRRSLRRRERIRQLASVEAPATTICRIFGRYCQEALQVARCESQLHTDAQNGQYLGLFQMGSLARQLYGHGETAEIQSRAALRYFVASGRDWSPWTCQPR
jgi:hypothetical protein